MNRTVRGVTLIELLVAIALLGIVLDVGFQILVNGQKMIHRQQRQASTLQDEFVDLARRRSRVLDSAIGRPVDSWLDKAHGYR